MGWLLFHVGMSPRNDHHHIIIISSSKSSPENPMALPSRETNISPFKGTLKIIFLFPRSGGIWGGKKTLRPFGMTLFFVIVFFSSLSFYRGFVITITNVTDLYCKQYFAWHHCPTEVLPALSARRQQEAEGAGTRQETLSAGEGGSKAGGGSGSSSISSSSGAGAGGSSKGN